MKAVILAGGLGTRMREETEFRPKPMVEVGGRPILWHIMKNLSVYGIREFILATGYKSDLIKDYFVNFYRHTNDVVVQLGQDGAVQVLGGDREDWTVTVAFTGESTMTGGRVCRVARYLDSEPFLVAYGDGLADVRIDHLLAFHKRHGRLATVTTVEPPSRFGVLDIDESGAVRQVSGESKVEGWVNIGYFVFEPDVLNYLDDECVLEERPLARLAQDGQLAAFQHLGFWQPMDTFRELTALSEMWKAGAAPWRMW